jgi:UDP-N-acetylmuramate--alanine ligase
MDIEDIHNAYFIGIGGIGMSALARYFSHMGKKVAGYDKTRTPLCEAMELMGMHIHYEDDITLIPDAFRDNGKTLVVYTPAVPRGLKELNYFTDAHFMVKKRSEVLGLITRDTFCFAVAGTHGKTTTSSILAHLLRETGTPITAFLGGISEDFNSNFIFDGNEFSVVEADEYDRSFLRLSPDVACITSMEADHLDIYGTAETLQQSFVEFTQCLKPNGKLFVRNGLPLKGYTYGIDDDSDFCIRNIKIKHGADIFDLGTPQTTLKGVKFNKPGRHNLLNGLVAFAMAIQAGPPLYRLAAALETFKGVDRRFSYRIKTEEFVFIDDYAHHPSEIDAVFQAVREMHPGKKTVAVFQPHLFTRTRDFGDEFAKSLSQFDHVLLLEIYPAREEPLAGIDASWLLDKIDKKEKKLVSKSNLVDEIRAIKPEVLIVMGAGDIGLEIPKMKSALEHGN